MACSEHITPCNCVPYESTGCLDTYNTDCVKYTGTAITCLDIASGDTLTEILGHLEDVVCGISPTAFSSYDYGCFSSQGITTQEEFVEFTSTLLCSILGSQTPSTVTSLSSLSASVASLTSTVTGFNSFTTLNCFEALTALPGPTATLSALIAAIQTLLCSHDSAINTLESLGGVALTANDSTTIDFTTSSTGNHTLTGSVKISSSANNSLSANSDGLYVQVPALTVTDTASVNLTSSGTLGHTLSADVKLSTFAGNTLVERTDGLYVPATSASETAVTVTDTNSIDLTAGGTNGHAISANVKIDPASDNIIAVTSGGLYANGSNFAISNNSVTGAKLRDSVGYSVIGKGTTGTGDPVDIVANADQVLRRSGSGDLTFGGIVTNNIDNAQVTFAKVQNIASQGILGRSTAGTGSIEQLTLGSHMNLSGGVLNTFGRTLIGVTTFTSSGTWTKPTGCNAIEVTVVGGGGGGAAATAASGQASLGAGGGAGGFRKFFFTSLFSASETVTVGAAGAAGTSGGSGAAGTDTLFGAIAKANGGSGGSSMATGTSLLYTAGGLGGGPAIAASNLSSIGAVTQGSGSAGTEGIRFSATVGFGGKGGASVFGGNGDQTSYGSGGNGATAFDGISNNGIAGTPGIVIVYEYS